MGTPLYDINYPLVKNNNALLAFAKADVPSIRRRPASAADAVVRTCPMGLMPSLIETAYKMKDVDGVEVPEGQPVHRVWLLLLCMPGETQLVVVNSWQRA